MCYDEKWHFPPWCRQKGQIGGYLTGVALGYLANYLHLSPKFFFHASLE
jgi:hypothetical protein